MEKEIKKRIIKELGVKKLNDKDWERAYLRLKDEFLEQSILEIVDKYAFDILVFMPKYVKTNRQKLDYLVNRLIQERVNYFESKYQIDKFIPSEFNFRDGEQVEKKKTFLDYLEEL
ncbi:MAG: hypothetical protein ACTTKY_00135 [Catonella sp.]